MKTLIDIVLTHVVKYLLDFLIVAGIVVFIMSKVNGLTVFEQIKALFQDGIMKKKSIIIEVPVEDLSESSKSLLGIILSVVATWPRTKRKKFDEVTAQSLGKKVLHVAEEYIEELAEKMNEQGLFGGKEKDDART